MKCVRVNIEQVMARSTAEERESAFGTPSRVIALQFGCHHSTTTGYQLTETSRGHPRPGQQREHHDNITIVFTSILVIERCHRPGLHQLFQVDKGWSVVGVAVSRGCGGQSWVWRSVVGVAVSCGCGGQLWVWRSVVGVAVSCGCGGQLWVWRSVVGVAVSCGCGDQLWVWWSVVGMESVIKQINGVEGVV